MKFSQFVHSLPLSIWSASFPVVLLQRVPLVQYAPWEPINLEKCWVEICIKFEKDCLVLGHCTSLLNFQLSVEIAEISSQIFWKNSWNHHFSKRSYKKFDFTKYFSSEREFMGANKTLKPDAQTINSNVKRSLFVKG